MNQMILTSDSESLEQLARDAKSLKKTSIPALFVKLRYRLWLQTLRDVSLLVCLVNNFDKVRKEDTFSYLLAKLFHDSSKMKKLLFSLEKRLRKRIY